MERCKLKRFTIVVMDATDEKVLYDIMATVSKTWRIVDGDTNNIKYIGSRPLFKENYSVLIYEYELTDEVSKAIQFRIEDLYPGLCVFNPPMGVYQKV